MTKVYTSEIKTPQQSIQSPKESVLNSILNFSKSLEVIDTGGKKDQIIDQVEIILN